MLASRNPKRPPREAEKRPLWAAWDLGGQLGTWDYSGGGGAAQSGGRLQGRRVGELGGGGWQKTVLVPPPPFARILSFPPIPPHLKGTSCR